MKQKSCQPSCSWTGRAEERQTSVHDNEGEYASGDRREGKETPFYRLFFTPAMFKNRRLFELFKVYIFNERFLRGSKL